MNSTPPLALSGNESVSHHAPIFGGVGTLADTPNAPQASPGEAGTAGLVELLTSGTSKSLLGEIRRVCRDSRLLRVYKSVSKAAELIQREVCMGGRKPHAAMVTLTYRPDVMWSGRHISDYLMHVRKWLVRRGAVARYVWVAELQKNGRVHYHVVIWLPKGLTLPKPDKQGHWKHGSSRIEWARKPVGYLVKYCSKGRLPGGFWFPRGCRLSGFGGLGAADRLERAWWVLPRYQRERCTPQDRACRAPGGGWVSKDTGEWWPSYWPEWAALLQQRRYENAVATG